MDGDKRRSVKVSTSLPQPSVVCPACREYVKAIRLYKQRVWACDKTGRSDLSYEEALLSEAAAVRASKKRPVPLWVEKLAVSTVHNSES